jgi:allantoate deiminase
MMPRVPSAAPTRAEPKRIARFLRELSSVGRDPKGGWSRLALSPEERTAHELFTRWASDLGMKVSQDPIGNTYAEIPSAARSTALLCGSHLDTVPQGGLFDGAAGVAAALEVARLLADSPLDHTFQIVVFSAEEGARFGAPCIGSRTATGAFSADTLRSLIDRDGNSAYSCALDAGLDPSHVSESVWPLGSIGAFLELHIEQGRVLESRRRALGIVDAISGSTRIELIFVGRSDHSGATPMNLRLDALTAASEFILEVERRAAARRTIVATVGRLDLQPGSITTVPGLARLSLDVRDVDSDRQRDLAELLLTQAARIASRRGLELSALLLSDQSPVVLHKPVRERLALAAQERGLQFSILSSGAGHDAAHVAAVAPAGMVFVPSRGGISHSPEEWSSAESIARGAEVMVGALRRLDEVSVELARPTTPTG